MPAQPVYNAIVTCISHGHTKTLLHGGLKPEWIEADNDVRNVLEAAYSLHRENAPINYMAIAVRCSGKLADSGRIRDLFSLNGVGDVSPGDVIRQTKDSHLVSQMEFYNRKIADLIKERPSEVSQWIPILAQRLQSLTLDTRAYDPRTTVEGQIVHPVFLASQHLTINKMFEGGAGDGGGYRVGDYNVWIGPTGKGKSTTSYTIAEDFLMRPKRVTFIAKENKEQIGARLLWALSYLTKQEIDTGVCSNFPPMHDKDGLPLIVHDSNNNPLGEWHKAEVRQMALKHWKEVIWSYSCVYPWRFVKPNINTTPAAQLEYFLSGVKNTLTWDNPDTLIVDYIGQTDVPGRNIVYELTYISEGLELIAHETGKNINTLWQMSNAETQAYLKNIRHIVSGPYGAGGVTHSADFCFQTRKHDLPDQQHFMRTKDRVSGQIEEYSMTFDRHRWVYRDLPLPDTGLEVGAEVPE